MQGRKINNKIERLQMPCLILSGQQLQLAQGSGMKNTHFPRRHLLCTEQEQSHRLPVRERRGTELSGMLDRSRGPPALLVTLILPDPQKGSLVRRPTVTAYPALRKVSCPLQLCALQTLCALTTSCLFSSGRLHRLIYRVRNSHWKLSPARGFFFFFSFLCLRF